MSTGETLTHDRVAKGRITFWTLFVSGTFVLSFGVLFAQTPSTDHTADAVIFGVATLLICMSLVIGVVQRRIRVSAIGTIGGLALAIELVVCIGLLVDALTHLHTL